MMDFTFKLPPGWAYRERTDIDAYTFWMENDPEYTFDLTKTALAIYGDDPAQLVKIIHMQMEMQEASKQARTEVPHGTQLPAYTLPEPEKVHRHAYGKSGVCIECGSVKPGQKIVQHNRKPPNTLKMAGVPDDYFDAGVHLPTWINGDWERILNWILHRQNPE